MSVAATNDHGLDVRHGDVERLRALARSLFERNAQLQHALESRVVIEQAKGVLAERLAVSPDEAFELLRSAARSNRLRLRDLAAAVVASRETPPAIVRAAGAAERR